MTTVVALIAVLLREIILYEQNEPGKKRGATPPFSAPSPPCATISAPFQWVDASSGRAVPSPLRRSRPSPPAALACNPLPVPSDPDRPGNAATSPASDRSPAASSVRSPAGTSPTRLSSIRSEEHTSELQ